MVASRASMWAHVSDALVSSGGLGGAGPARPEQLAVGCGMRVSQRGRKPEQSTRIQLIRPFFSV